MHGFFLSAARRDTCTCIRPRSWSQTHQQGFQVKSRLGVPDKSLQLRQAAFLSALRSRHDSRTVSPDQITLKLQQRQRSSGKTTGGRPCRGRGLRARSIWFISCQRKSVLVNNSAAVEIKPSPTFLSWALQRKSATRPDTQNLDRRSASLSGESRPRYQSAPTTTCLNSWTDLCQADRKTPALLPVRKPTTIKHTEQPKK